MLLVFVSFLLFTSDFLGHVKGLCLIYFSFLLVIFIHPSPVFISHSLLFASVSWNFLGGFRLMYSKLFYVDFFSVCFKFFSFKRGLREK